MNGPSSSNSKYIDTAEKATTSKSARKDNKLDNLNAFDAVRRHDRRHPTKESAFEDIEMI